MVRLVLLLAAASAVGRPPLFFREDFKETPAATPITQEHIVNPKVTIAMYGPGREGVKKSHHDTPADDPFYVWDGTCAGNCVVTLKGSSAVDLTGQAKLRWRTKQSGFRRLHLVLKLATGTWIVSDAVDSSTSVDWRESEVVIADQQWRALDIKTVIEGAVVKTPDLSRVEEIGWSTLMTGGGTPASSRVDWVEIYGTPVARK